jgi:Putative transmembrane protein (PGPGW)
MLYHTVRAGRVAVGGVLLTGGAVLSLPLVPGPGIVLVLGGLALLSHEFEWARRLRDRLHDTARRVTGRPKPKDETGSDNG